MVVPTDRGVSEKKSKKYLGNSQTINVGENHSTLKVIGNFCKLNVSKNEGCIKIIGDGCKVSVESGRGTINYVGNNGLVEIGEFIDERSVEYVGNSGKILKMVDGKLNETNPRKKKEVECKTTVNLNNQKSVHLGNCRKIYIPYYEISILKTHKK